MIKTLTHFNRLGHRIYLQHTGTRYCLFNIQFGEKLISNELARFILTKYPTEQVN
jgi:hypothetical protein